jgi:transcriptional regulator with XRE-family HTH domain
MELNTTRIRKEMDKMGLNQSALARQAGVSRQFISLKLLRPQSFSWRTIVKLADALGVEPQEIIRR